MNRAVLSFVCAAAAKHWPFPAGNALLELIHFQKPLIWTALKYGWLAMRFTTPWLVFSVAFSLAFIFFRRSERCRLSNLPPYPVAGDQLAIVIGEVHHPTKPEPVEHPRYRVGANGLAVVASRKVAPHLRHLLIEQRLSSCLESGAAAPSK